MKNLYRLTEIGHKLTLTILICSATLMTGCIFPGSRRTADTLVNSINTYNAGVASSRKKDDTITFNDLPGGFGWTNLDSYVNARPETDRRRALADYNQSVTHNIVTERIALFSANGTERREEERRELAKFSYEYEGDPLPGGLKHKWALQNLIYAAMSTNRTAKVNVLEIYGLAVEAFSQIHSNLLNGSASPGGNTTLGKILEGYYLAYMQGKFTLRDGTVLGKPTLNNTNSNGAVSVTIPDSDVSGIATVFTEAICDYGYSTPVFYSISNSVSYTAVYAVPSSFSFATVDTNGNMICRSLDGKNQLVPTKNTFIQLYTVNQQTNRVYFANNKTPTAAAFVPCIEVVTNYEEKKTLHGGITAQEEGFIRAVSNLTETESKALAGLLVRSFGNVGVGGEQYAIGSFHISLGDNQVLSQIVEDLLSSFSSHVTENDLTKVFWKYDGGDPTTQTILKNYSKLLSQVNNL